MKVIIREAKKKDADSILKLIKELALFEREASEVILTKENIEIFKKKTNLIVNEFLAEADENNIKENFISLFCNNISTIFDAYTIYGLFIKIVKYRTKRLMNYIFNPKVKVSEGLIFEGRTFFGD